MASRLFAAAAASSPLPLARRITSRGLSGPQGRRWYSEKVNLWEDPRSPMRWKISHFVVATWTVWGVLVFGGFKIFGGEKKQEDRGVGQRRGRLHESPEERPISVAVRLCE